MPLFLVPRPLRKVSRHCLALCLLLSAGTLAAQTPTAESTAPGIAIGQPLPAVHVEQHGELLLGKDNKPGFIPWHSTELSPQRIHLIQYMAATMGASRINKHFTDILDTKTIDYNYFQSTTLINLEDAMWGTGGIILNELRATKRKYPKAHLVADSLGVGLRTWGLQRNSYAVIITDTEHNVLFFKDGTLDAAEVETALSLILDGTAALKTAAEGETLP